MRKLLLLIVTFCYIASTSGVAVQWHYCMGKLRSVDIGLANHDETCGKCGMVKGNNHCCKDEVSVAKVSDSHHQTNQLAFAALSLDAIVTEPIVLPKPFVQLLVPAYAYQSNAPPDIVKNRTILYQVFRC
jgi:hypothetical protein